MMTTKNKDQSRRRDLPSLVTSSDEVVSLCDVVVPEDFYNRVKCGVAVMDQLFGGPEMPGVVRGQTVLFTGCSGSGKTTLSLQLAELYSRAGVNVLYNCGEMNRKMLKVYADRLKIRGDFKISSIDQVDQLTKRVADEGFELLFQDSLQTLKDGSLSGDKLAISVERKLQRVTDGDVTVFIIGHVTKGGVFAGRNTIQHDLDAHLHISINKQSGSRIACMEKNRLGPANKPYEFLLAENGLEIREFQEEEIQPQARAQDQRRDEYRELIRSQLVDKEERVSGLCFHRLKSACSEGFWRMVLRKLVADLRTEGHIIEEKKYRVCGKCSRAIVEDIQPCPAQGGGGCVPTSGTRAFYEILV